MNPLAAAAPHASRTVSGGNREIIQAFAQRLLPDTSWVSDRFPLYFCTERELCRINTAGSGFEIVFRSDESVGAFHFSPDGKMLLMLTGPSCSLYLVDLEGYRSRMIDSQKLLPDERYVMMAVEFTEKPTIVILDPASGKMGRLTYGKRYAWYEQKVTR